MIHFVHILRSYWYFDYCLYLNHCWIPMPDNYVSVHSSTWLPWVNFLLCHCFIDWNRTGIGQTKSCFDLTTLYLKSQLIWQSWLCPWSENFPSVSLYILSNSRGRWLPTINFKWMPLIRYVGWVTFKTPLVITWSSSHKTPNETTV